VNEPPSLSIVIPAFNEEARLPNLLRAIAEAKPAFASSGLTLSEVVVVDDGSTDQTADMLRSAASASNLLKPLLRGLPNNGKGAAVAAGVKAARGDLVLLADADVATPFAEVSKLYVEVRKGADLAVASRDTEGSYVTGAPRIRIVAGRLFNAFVRGVTGLRIRDTQCGFKLMRTDHARLLLKEQTVEGFAFDVELLMRAMTRGLTIAEVGVTYRHGSDSTVSPFRHAPRMAFDTVRLARAIRRGRRRDGT
jgi:dolichyl-phosphate beta-glucosyltransferase